MEAYIMPALIAIVTLVAVLALAANARASEPAHSQIAGLLQSASLARGSGDHGQSAMLYERALGLIDSMKKVDESLLSECLVNYSDVLDKSGERRKAEEHRKRLLAIWNSALASGDADLMTEVDYLCANATFGAQTADVANYYERLLAAREKTHSPNSEVFINTVVIYARLMRSLGEKAIADQLEQHAENLRAGGANQIEVDSDENTEPPQSQD